MIDINWTPVAIDENTTHWTAAFDGFTGVTYPLVIVGRTTGDRRLFQGFLGESGDGESITDPSGSLGATMRRVADYVLEQLDFDALAAGPTAAPRAEVPADLDDTRATPLTVSQAMDAMLAIARKVDVRGANPMELDDLADLTLKLGRAFDTRRVAASSLVVAEQHEQASADRPDDAQMVVIAAASRETARDTERGAQRAYQQLASAIGAYGFDR